MIEKPIQVKALKQFSLWLQYSDKTEGEIDLSHLAGLPVFKNWVNPDFFKKVYIDPETNAISWDENIEICPDSLYLKLKGMTFEEWKSNQYSYATGE